MDNNEKPARHPTSTDSRGCDRPEQPTCTCDPEVGYVSSCVGSAYHADRNETTRATYANEPVVTPGEAKQDTTTDPTKRCICGGGLMDPEENRVGSHFRCHMAAKNTVARIERIIEGYRDQKARLPFAAKVADDLLAAIRGGDDA